MDRGDRVRAGQVIARLTDDGEHATIDLPAAQATGQLGIGLQEAKVNPSAGPRTRSEALAARGIAARAQLEQAWAVAEVVRLEPARAELRRRIAGFDLERARRAPGQRTIRSSISGRLAATVPTVDRVLGSGSAPSGVRLRVADLHGIPPAGRRWSVEFAFPERPERGRSPQPHGVVASRRQRRRPRGLPRRALAD